MKNISINSIGRQLFLISLLTILPIGCATENEETQESVTEKTEISSPKEEVDRTEKDNKLTQENDKSPIEEIAIEQPVELTEIENIIYFDFDSADLTEEAKANLRQIAPKLLNSDRNITVVGHADERGSHEYNMDLGRRRAEAVKQFLATLWAEGKLSTISYGETQPLVEESNPEAWAKNRRVEFIIAEPSQATR